MAGAASHDALIVGSQNSRMEPRRAPAGRSFGLGIVLAVSMGSAVVASVATVSLMRPDYDAPTARSASVVLAATPVPSAGGSSNSAAPGTSAGSGVQGGAPSASAPDSGSAPSAIPGSSVGPGSSAGPGASVGPGDSLAAIPEPNAVIVAVAAKVSPAVVTITSDIAANQFDPFSVQSSGVGSGFVFASDGWILTNDHVIEGATTLTVAFNDGRELKARVVLTDANADLAVLKVGATGLATVDIGTSKDLRVGQLLIAIGSPLGTFSDSVTSGILSATGRSITVSDYQTRQRRQMTNLLQTDAAINPGNSGGPLLDASGKVIGISSAVAASAEGIGFAIPIDAARAFMDQARQKG